MTDDRVLTCTDCQEDVSSSGESAPKMFKFHVKRNHKQQLQAYDDNGSVRKPYREFLSAEDIDKLESTDVPL